MNSSTPLLDPVWQGARALVVGMGTSGLAMAVWLMRCGATVSVLDTRADPPQKAALLATGLPVTMLHCALAEVSLEGFDVLAWSPGLSIELGEGAALYARARDAGIKVVGELDLFLSAIDSQRATGYQPRLIGVTGTNGKTTVTALTAHLCHAAGQRAIAAGNIGPAMLDAWMDAGDALPQVWVLELSSFQTALASPLSSLSPQHKVFDAVALLNLSQDHLDWHLSMETYQKAKFKLVDAARIQVLGEGCGFDIEPPVKLVPLKGAALRNAEALPPVAVIEPSKVLKFSAHAPLAVGDFGLVQDGSLKWLAAGTPGEETVSRRKDVQVELIVKRLMPADALRIRGEHNHLNALAALALCRAIGLPLHALLHGLRDYKGEPHRCELISIIDDVEYLDDSKGTNVGATVAGLLGLGKPCHLILGGEGKGQDFSPLLAPVLKHARSLLMIGRDAQRIAAALAASGVDTIFCDSLEDAVRQGALRARTGEAVLLSPACASFDMFKSYVHRGEMFQAAVAALAASRGQITEVAV